MRIFLSIFLVATLGTSVWADTICRQPLDASFGSSVSSRPDNGFVITEACTENPLVVKKPVRLSALISQRPRGSSRGVSLPAKSGWTVFFDLAKANLDESDRLIMNQIPVVSKVRVTGYTCSIGNEDFNDKLSRRRAEVVASYLRSRGVVTVAIEGKGECCPVSATDLSKNRRVFIQEKL